MNRSMRGPFNAPETWYETKSLTRHEATQFLPAFFLKEKRLFSPLALLMFGEKDKDKDEFRKILKDKDEYKEKQ